MNRLFEALSLLEMDQPSPNGVPQAVDPHDVIQLGTRAIVVALPASAQEAETEQLPPEAVPTGVIPPDVLSLISAEEAEREQLSSQAVLTDVSPFDAPSPMSAEEAEVEQLLLEAVLTDESPSDVALPASAQETEMKQLSLEFAPLEVSLLEAATPTPAQEAETEQLSSETAPTDVSPSDVPSPMSAGDAETEQLSSEAVLTDVSPSDVPSPISAVEAETEQLSPEAAPLEVCLSEVAPPKPAQQAAVEKGSQPKSAKSVAAAPVHVHVPPESRLVALTDPNCLGAEKFRALVTRLERLHKQSELKCFQVTSSVMNEGKTLVAGNVAVTLAKHFGSKTLLIEGDLHRPTLATKFGLHNMRGLSHWWSGRDQGLAQFVHRLDDLPLWFLPAGRACERPSDILRSSRFVKAFEELASQFEWIVVDSTPMLAIVEVNLWSRLVDGTLLVVREGVTPVKALKQSLRALDHPKLIGVVLNDALATDEAVYHSHYYGSLNR